MTATFTTFRRSWLRRPGVVCASFLLMTMTGRLQAQVMIANDIVEVDPTVGVTSVVDVLANDSHLQGLPPFVDEVTGACVGGSIAEPTGEDEGLYLLFTPSGSFEAPCVFSYTASSEDAASGTAQLTLLPGQTESSEPPLPTGNLLTNGGFEAGSIGWTEVAAQGFAAHTGFRSAGSGIAAPHQEAGGPDSFSAYAINNLASGYVQQVPPGINSGLGVDWTLELDALWGVGAPSLGGWRVIVIPNSQRSLTAPPTILAEVRTGPGTGTSCLPVPCQIVPVAGGFTRFTLPFTDDLPSSPITLRLEIEETSGHVVFDDFKLIRHTTEGDKDKLSEQNRNGDFELGLASWEVVIHDGFPNTSVTTTGLLTNEPGNAADSSLVATNMASGYVESSGSILVTPGKGYCFAPRRRGGIVEDESFSLWKARLVFTGLGGPLIVNDQVSAGQPGDPLSATMAPAPAVHTKVVEAPGLATWAHVRLYQQFASGWIEYETRPIDILELDAGTFQAGDPCPDSAPVSKRLPDGEWTLHADDDTGGSYVSPTHHPTATTGLLTNRAWGYLASDLVRVSEDGRYQLSAWLRGSMVFTLHGEYRVEARFFALDGVTEVGVPEVVHSGAVPPADWTKVGGANAEFGTPPGVGAAWLQVRLYDFRSHGWVAYDDVELLQTAGTVPPPGPIVQADSFTGVEEGGPAAELLVLDNDLGSGLQVIAVSLPAAGGFSEVSPGGGSVLYTPPAVAVTDSFLYTVRDASGGFGSASVTVEVAGVNEAPQARLLVECVDQGSTASCAAAGWLSSDPDGDALNYSFDFGEGSPVSAPLGRATHVYQTGGRKTITLTVQDPGGLTDSDSKSVDLDLDPTAVLSHSCVETHCTFWVNQSSDDVGLQEFTLDFGDATSAAGLFAVPPSATPAVIHDYAGSGDYPVTLEVRDGTGGSDAAAVVAVVDTRPVAAFVVQRSLADVVVDASGSSDDRGIQTYSWDFGDGAVASGVTASHSYAGDGSYTITLTVSDGTLTDTVAQSVRAVTLQTFTKVLAILVHSRRDDEPQANMVLACDGDLCTLDPNGSSDDRGLTSFAVTWDDGSPDSRQSFSSTAQANVLTHQFPAAGTYQVTLEVTDTRGKTAVVTTSLSVQEKARSSKGDTQ